MDGVRVAALIPIRIHPKNSHYSLQGFTGLGLSRIIRISGDVCKVLKGELSLIQNSGKYCCGLQIRTKSINLDTEFA